MKAKQASMALAFVAALAFAGQPAPASAQRGGKGRSGGGHSGRSSSGAVRSGGHAGRSQSGGSHAVPRGRAPGRSYTVAPVRSYRGGSSVARHPRPGYSFSGYGRSSRYGRGLSGYYRSYGPRYYGGNYRPYRGYSLGRLAYSWWPSLSFSYYDSPYYDSPYYDYPTSPGYVIDESAGAPGPDDDAGYDDGGSAYDTPSYADTGRLLLVITPSDAAVYMDDDYWGNGRDARSITLRSGSHTIEIVRPGFLPVRRSLVVVRGQTSEFRVDLPRP